MFLEKIKTPGIAHLSYIVGDGRSAAVIDPRRDTQVYRDLARAEGAQIKYIFETHRNEDLVSGSCQLAAETGAEIYHGQALDFEYGQSAREGDSFELGKLKIKVLETPGHTFESLSFVLYDTDYSAQQAIGVFTGDCLFIGDVGRTDFYPDRREEVSELLYDSIFNKLLPLGDAVLLYPAHGSGSVCGAGLASREFSSLGYERQHNPQLQKTREDFVAFKSQEHHYYPPYFKTMEEMNLKGPELLGPAQSPLLLNVAELKEKLQDEQWQIIDLRSPEAYCGSHIPGSQAIPLDMVASFGAWLLSYDKHTAVICEGTEWQELNTTLARMGFDPVKAVLKGGLSAWETAAQKLGTINVVSVQALRRKRQESAPHLLLDVRSKDEFENKHLEGAEHIYLGQLPQKYGELPRGREIITFCGSGKRALIAASVLENAGFENVSVCLGSMKAWMALDE